MVKIKCVSGIRCSECGEVGLSQVFLNNSGQIKYVRIRHYLKLDPTTNKPLFDYHRNEITEELKSLLQAQGFSISDTSKAVIGHKPQGQAVKSIAPNLNNSSLNQEVEPRAGFGPATITLPR